LTVQTIAALKANMPIGVAAGITVYDIHDLIDTVENRTRQINLPKTADYTADVADNRCRILFTSASLVSLILPDTLPDGWDCSVVQMGAGAVQITASGGGTLLSRAGHSRTGGQYAEIYLFVLDNTGNAARFMLSGDTVAS
jgi:hypothetical protein